MSPICQITDIRGKCSSCGSGRPLTTSAARCRPVGEDREMCFGKAPKPPKPPKPIEPPSRQDVVQAGDDERRRLAYRKGFASTINTTPLGDPGFGRGSVQPSAGGAPATLGTA